jgi:hypothetical protein
MIRYAGIIESQFQAVRRADDVNGIGEALFPELES